MKNKQDTGKYILLFALTVFLLFPQKVLAENCAKIMSCQMASSKKLRVIASCDPVKVNGSTCYLFARPFDGGKLSSKAKPLARAGKAATMSFTVKIRKSKRTEYYYYQYVIAQKNKKGKYEVISSPSYITNPGRTARYKYSFPKAASKKGLQVCGSMLEDAVDLNVRHSVLNINFTDLIATGAERNKSRGISYKYNGETWWFKKATVNHYDRQLKALKETDCIVSAVLLLGWRNDLTYLITPGGRKRGHAYYAWNVGSSKARKTLQASLSFLASRYAAKKAKYGRIVNWIVGNEVDCPNDWNYCGKVSLQTYASNYAKQFRMTYTAVTSVYANARVYISLTHLWNTKFHGSYTARAMLDAFAAAISATGYIPWNLAYHPYSSPLTEPRFWENKNQQLTAALTSPVINMGNLSVLTNYVKTTYGRNTRIILSEQGFTSKQKKKDTQKEQSAAIAYSYLLAEADDMVDSFIMNRHVDHTVETRQGLNLGLWTSSAMEWADKKKASWEVFKYMDSNLSEDVTTASLPVIGIQNWADVIPGYSSGFYAKYNVTKGDLQQVAAYKKTASVSSGWKKYGASGSLKKKKKKKIYTYTIKHASSVNKNNLWGMTQSFGKRLDFSAHPVLYATVCVKGAKNKKAAVRIRAFSGRNVFECERIVTAGKKVKLGVSLAEWPYRNSVSKIQILAQSTGAGWNKKSKMTVTDLVRGQVPG